MKGSKINFISNDLQITTRMFFFVSVLFGNFIRNRLANLTLIRTVCEVEAKINFN
jgi:hypothetical protein